MEKFEIDSYYYNEHTKELNLYKKDRVYMTICYDTTPSNDDIDEMIKDIEEEQTRTNEFFNQLNK
jgi:hypothetical protein